MVLGSFGVQVSAPFMCRVGRQPNNKKIHHGSSMSCGNALIVTKLRLSFISLDQMMLLLY